MIYLDYNSSAPCVPEVREKILEVLSSIGNASSVHRCGQRVHLFLTEARRSIAEYLDISANNFLFSSGATESNFLILNGAPCEVILVSALSHPSALETVKHSGKEFHILPVTPEGLLDLEVLQSFLDQYRSSKILLSLSYGESETGLLQPLEPLREMIAARNVFFHIDASQSLGRVPLSLRSWNVDAASFSGHKVGGPQGVGGVYLRNGASVSASIRGGGQERNLRSGTPNVSGAVGFAEALKHQSAGMWKTVRDRRDSMEKDLLMWNPHLYIAGYGQERLPNTSLIALGPLSSSLQVIRLDGEGICVSAGSACSSQKPKALHSLTVMSLSEPIKNSGIRVSLGPKNTWEEVSFFIQAYQRIHEGTAKPGLVNETGES